MLDVVEGRMVADTLGKIAGKGASVDTGMAAGTRFVSAAENESAGVEC